MCRSEEPGGTSIHTYPRSLEGLARKSDSKRKRQRDAKKERQAAQQQEAAGEVKRLKNLKMQEVQNECAPTRWPPCKSVCYILGTLGEAG